jgi:hypothetical protein
MGSSPFRDEPYFQGDKTTFQWENCVLAACTELIGRETVGALRIPAHVLRKTSGDKSGGVTYSQAAEAVANQTHGRILLKARYGLGRGQVRDMSAAGRGFCISLDTSVTINTSRRTGTFQGCHTVYVNQYAFRGEGECQCERGTVDEHAEYLVEDPGTSAGYRWWSASLLYRAAEKRTGGNGINTLAGADTEGVTRVGAMAGRIRGTTQTTGPDLGPVVIGKEYTVLSTERGGPWKRADGTTALGWHRIEHDGGEAFLAGERLSK